MRSLGIGKNVLIIDAAGSDAMGSRRARSTVWSHPPVAPSAGAASAVVPASALPLLEPPVPALPPPAIQIFPIPSGDVTHVPAPRHSLVDAQSCGPVSPPAHMVWQAVEIEKEGMIVAFAQHTVPGELPQSALLMQASMPIISPPSPSNPPMPGAPPVDPVLAPPGALAEPLADPLLPVEAPAEPLADPLLPSAGPLLELLSPPHAAAT